VVFLESREMLDMWGTSAVKMLSLYDFDTEIGMKKRYIKEDESVYYGGVLEEVKIMYEVLDGFPEEDFKK